MVARTLSGSKVCLVKPYISQLKGAIEPGRAIALIEMNVERARRQNIKYQGPRLSLMFDASSEPSRPTSRSTIPHQHVHHTPPTQTREKRRKDSSTEKSPNSEIRRPTFTSRSRQLIRPMLKSTKLRGPRSILTLPSIFLVDGSSRKNLQGSHE